jgi:hypothetical protein
MPSSPGMLYQKHKKKSQQIDNNSVKMYHNLTGLLILHISFPVFCHLNLNFGETL